MPPKLVSAQRFLDAAYEGLGYQDGRLLRADSEPTVDTSGSWVDVGDWLALAKRVEAERVFFVGDDPVIVFRAVRTDNDDAIAIEEAYRKAWCLSGPQCLFLATSDTLRVYALNKPPVRPGSNEKLTPLMIVQRAEEVAAALQAFSRERVESGVVFRNQEFEDNHIRADRRLVQDLRIVRSQLISAGLSVRDAHALIGRSIFIRYLEDRGVLKQDYFSQIASRSKGWQEVLDRPLARENLNPLSTNLYLRVLSDKGFTTALFDQLALDFNGDMFISEEGDRERVYEQHHLDLLQGFLVGETDSDQPTLFFWAYDFGVIPISLISSIYEEFYHSENAAEEPTDNESDVADLTLRTAGKENTHYTPASLVDDVLRRVLTVERLSTNPTVLDPACGSGIFLVEAFRRIVRFHTARRGTITPVVLRSILHNQIRGVEIDREAVRVAAFSLYLALLNYHEPREIVPGNRLPRLIYNGIDDSSNFPVLYHANAFNLTTDEHTALGKYLEQNRKFPGRIKLVRLYEAPKLPIARATINVIVGNPPWAEARQLQRVQAVGAAMNLAVEWSQAFGIPIGDKNPSQLFIARALSLVDPNGEVALLVHAKVLHNTRSGSRAFRRWWLSRASLHEVINFTQARRVFFDRAVAPFVLARFSRSGCPLSTRESHVQMDSAETPCPFPSNSVVYSSARLSSAAERLRSVTFMPSDRRLIEQSDLLGHDDLWKIYWWGSSRDVALISRLRAEPSLQEVINPGDPQPAYGFQRPSGNRRCADPTPSKLIAELKEIQSGRIQSFGPLRNEWFSPPPAAVDEPGNEALYSGQRLIASRGVHGGLGPSVRLETGPFSFRHNILGVGLHSKTDYEARAILGILWSSLARYFQFMTTSSWGIWYDSLTKEEFLSTPIRIPHRASHVGQRLDKIVTEIQTWESTETDLFGKRIDTGRPEHLFAELDEVVFEVFELGQTERMLVKDRLFVALDMLRNGTDAVSIRRVSLPIVLSGSSRELATATRDVAEVATGDLSAYLAAFLRTWNRELERYGSEFVYRVVRPPNVPLIAIAFEVRDVEGPNHQVGGDEGDWQAALANLAPNLLTQESRRVYTESAIRAVSDDAIVIIKRDERRLWTFSSAMEDVDASMSQLMRLRAASVTYQN